MTAPLYKSSGKVTFTGLAGGAAAGLIAGPILGAVYAVAIAYIPFVYLNALLTALFGAAVAFAVAFAMTRGKVRNTWLVVMASLGATALAHYVGWMVWVAVIFFRADAELPILAILFPPTFAELVLMISREGAWTIRGNAVSGPFLWVIWFIEAGIVFGVSALVAFTTASNQPFCESCEAWCKPKDATLRLSADVDGEGIKSRLLALDLAVLAETSRSDPSDSAWHQVDLSVCECCGATNTLTLAKVSVSYDKKGRRDEKRDELVYRILVSSEQVAWIEGVASAPATQPHEAANTPLV